MLTVLLRFLLIDEIEDLRQYDQATLLSLLQDRCLVETKVSKTRRLDITCSVFVTCNDTKKLKGRLSIKVCDVTRSMSSGN
jgi:MoxR-like ATPase